MPRLYTRRKRKMQLTSSFKHRFRNFTASSRARTFSSEDAAKAYAQTHGISDFTVVPAKKGKRFKISTQ